MRWHTDNLALTKEKMKWLNDKTLGCCIEDKLDMLTLTHSHHSWAAPVSLFVHSAIGQISLECVFQAVIVLGGGLYDEQNPALKKTSL